MAEPSPRKPARRMAEIPRRDLAGLNNGTISPGNLVEWLAIDRAKLMAAVLPEIGLEEAVPPVTKAARASSALGILQRVETVARALHAALEGHRGRSRISEAIGAHPSAAVREYGPYLIAFDKRMDFAAQLEAMRPFADDPDPGLREIAWMVLRPAVAEDIPRAVRRLQTWTEDNAPNIRRYAIEITRPCGVWCAHIPALKTDPAPVLPLLEACRADPARYVQNSVANWLNDASKTQPDWVRQLTRRWSKASKEKATDYIVKRALRTLEKEK